MLTFCIRVMSPERHHWKPAVQATAVMLRMPPVDGQSPASKPRPLAIYGAQCWERLRHPPVTNQQRAHTPRKLEFALCCHSNATHAPIANPPNSAQLEGSLYHTSKLHPGPCSNVGVRPRTDTDTQTRVTTIHFASSTTHAKCNNRFTVLWPGLPVWAGGQKKRFTNPPSWSSSNLYQLLPSICTTIHSILLVQIMCLAIILHNLCPCPL